MGKRTTIALQPESENWLKGERWQHCWRLVKSRLGAYFSRYAGHFVFALNLDVRLCVQWGRGSRQQYVPACLAGCSTPSLGTLLWELAQAWQTCRAIQSDLSDASLQHVRASVGCPQCEDRVMAARAVTVARTVGQEKSSQTRQRFLTRASP